MRSGKIMMFGILASALLGGACNRADEPRNDSAVREEANSAEVAAKRQQERSEEIAGSTIAWLRSSGSTRKPIRRWSPKRRPRLPGCARS